MNQLSLFSPTTRIGAALLMSLLLSSCSCMCPEIRYDENTRIYSQPADTGTASYSVGRYDDTTARYQQKSGPETRKYTIGKYAEATDYYINRQKNSDISPKPRVIGQTGGDFPANMTPAEQKASLPLVIEASDVLFEFDKAVIKAPYVPELNRWVEYFKDNPFVTAEIYGHADSTGPADYNLKLSERRAAAVVKYLVDHGITRERLTAKGFGEMVPVAPNDTPEGRQKNRRVELKL